MKRKLLLSAILLGLLSAPLWTLAQESAHFKVAPYLQNPAPNAMTLRWVSYSRSPAVLSCFLGEQRVAQTQVLGRAADSLDYTEWEKASFPSDVKPVGFFYSQRVSGLQANQAYRYLVEQDGQTFEGHFRTAPTPDRSVRIVAYSDCETEPESHGTAVKWEPSSTSPKNPERTYLVDQSVGYQANLDAIRVRKPDLIVIAGDIVESGGEQRDWDEFWNHNAPGQPGATGIASEVPILAAVGNHEYFAGPKNGGYQGLASERAVSKYLSYFDVPSNQAKDARHHGRYARLDYGPVTLITLDGCNGLPHQTNSDTNFYLSAPESAAPDFNPGSEQYRWLEAQLAEADKSSRFVFVCFHHCPASSGVHAAPPGQGRNQDPQSSQPLRALFPLLARYRVDALLTGHDEMMERSEVAIGNYKLQVFDVGVAGDGLRGPSRDNPERRFLAHADSPEVWQNGVLKDGGKHYGHLDIDVQPISNKWQVTFTPVYVFPVFADGQLLRFERRVYPDRLTLPSQRN